MIRCDAWTELELQELYEVVNDADWFYKAAPQICRSDRAIRAKMCALRREAGIIPKPGPSAKPARLADRDRAIFGSAKLCNAIHRMAA